MIRRNDGPPDEQELPECPECKEGYGNTNDGINFTCAECDHQWEIEPEQDPGPEELVDVELPEDYLKDGN